MIQTKQVFKYVLHWNITIVFFTFRWRDSFHIVSAHAPNSLVPRYLREITREGATCIRLPYIAQWNMEND